MDAATKSDLLPRTYLFVPGSRPERFEKALASGADSIIIDLEDAVAPQDKERARELVSHWLHDATTQVCIRINASDTSWYNGDVEAFANHANVAALVVPKADSVQSLREIQRRGRDGLALIPIIESASGLASLQEIASSGTVQRLMFGTIDLQVDLGTDLGDEDLNSLRLQFSVASKVGGIGSPVDGVTTVLDDAEVLRRAALNAKRYGFGGKLCIHPRQIESVHQGLAPSVEECDWARRILAAAETSAGEATVLDGKMVDLPVILKARAILTGARDPK